MKLRVLIFVGVLFLIITGVNSQSLKIFAGGGINFVGKYGSVDDYIAGENDFPVTPSHRNSVITGSLSYTFYKNFGFLLKSSYHMRTSVSLEDPSDGDSVEVNTSPHFSLSLNLEYSFQTGRFQPFLYIGGGFDKLLAKDEVYTSSYGYEIVFLKPEKSVDPMFNFGGGVDFKLFSSLFLRVRLEYTLIFSNSENIGSFETSAGLCLEL